MLTALDLGRRSALPVRLSISGKPDRVICPRAVCLCTPGPTADRAALYHSSRLSIAADSGGSDRISVANATQIGERKTKNEEK